MIKETITARKGSGDNVEEFSTEVDMPENLAEAAEVWGEDETFNLAKRNYVINVQANLRRPSEKKTISTKEVYDKLIASGMPEAQARDISKYSG